MFAGETEPHGVCGRLRARAGAELLEDCGDVVVDGALGEHELVCDLGVWPALGDEPPHLELTGRVAGWVGTRRQARPRV
jgi:hypothetical protein